MFIASPHWTPGMTALRVPSLFRVTCASKPSETFPAEVTFAAMDSPERWRSERRGQPDQLFAGRAGVPVGRIAGGHVLLTLRSAVAFAFADHRNHAAADVGALAADRADGGECHREIEHVAVGAPAQLERGEVECVVEGGRGTGARRRVGLLGPRVSDGVLKPHQFALGIRRHVYFSPTITSRPSASSPAK